MMNQMNVPERPGVTFATNVYEKTLRTALAPGFVDRMVRSHGHPFAERLLMINNVQDRAFATQLALQAIQRGEIDRFVFVDDVLDLALEKCGLTRQRLGKMRHYSDLYLAVMVSVRTQFLVYQDVEFVVYNTFDWVSQGVQELQRIPEALLVAPSWRENRDIVLQEGFAQDGAYVISYGFTEACMLIRPSDFAAPIYGRMHLASLRYPVAVINPVFEQWVDSYMRLNRKWRLSDLRLWMEHTGEEGANYRHFTSLQRAKLKLYGPLWRFGMRWSDKQARRYLASCGFAPIPLTQ